MDSTGDLEGLIEDLELDATAAKDNRLSQEPLKKDELANELSQLEKELFSDERSNGAPRKSYNADAPLDATVPLPPLGNSPDTPRPIPRRVEGEIGPRMSSGLHFMLAGMDANKSGLPLDSERQSSPTARSEAQPVHGLGRHRNSSTSSDPASQAPTAVPLGGGGPPREVNKGEHFPFVNEKQLKKSSVVPIPHQEEQLYIEEIPARAGTPTLQNAMGRVNNL